MYTFLFIKVKANVRQAFTKTSVALVRYVAYLVSHQLISLFQNGHIIFMKLLNTLLRL